MRRGTGVLFIGNFLSRHGLSRYPIEDLAERVAAQGFRVVSASPIRNGWLRATHMLTAAILKRADYKVAIIDLYSRKAFLWGALAARVVSILNRHVVLVLHGGGLPRFAEGWPRLVGAVLSRATVVVAPSPYLAEGLHRFRHDIRVVPNAIDLDAYEFRVRSSPQPRLVWLRCFRNIYHPELAPQVLKLLMEDFPSVRLRMLGLDWGDGTFQRTKSLAKRLKVDKRIETPGAVAKATVPHWLNQSDIFLNTSRIDNTPVSVIEAMACGLCVVSTDVGGMKELIEDGVNGILVPPNDPEAMAGAVRTVLRDPVLAERLSRTARRSAEQFGWHDALSKWISLLAPLGAGSAEDRAFESDLRPSMSSRFAKEKS